MIWKQELKTNIRTIQDFRNFYLSLNIEKGEIEDVEIAIRNFGINIPRQYLSDLIDDSSSQKELLQIKALVTPRTNPLLKNTIQEGITFVESTDQDKNPLRGLTRMYSDRVLISPIHHCIGNCQWCFRTKEEESFLSNAELNAIYEYIRKDNKISDVILTGGEPLLISDEKLDGILHSLRNIKHVDIIRFHTRAPVFLPSRINSDLLSIFKKYSSIGKPIYVVTHYVHPLELSNSSVYSVDQLLCIGIPVYNQAAVLKGINDDQETFDKWHKKMIKYKVKPYYIASPVIRDGVNSRFYVPLPEVEELHRNYSKKHDGLGRATLIVPVMGKKLTSAEYEEHISKRKYEMHIRKTKIEIQ